MKKIITLVVAIIFLISCSKKQECWVCTTTYIADYEDVGYDEFETEQAFCHYTEQTARLFEERNNTNYGANLGDTIKWINKNGESEWIVPKFQLIYKTNAKCVIEKIKIK